MNDGRSAGIDGQNEGKAKGCAAIRLEILCPIPWIQDDTMHGLDLPPRDSSLLRLQHVADFLQEGFVLIGLAQEV